jgi:hypothetical protein
MEIRKDLATWVRTKTAAEDPDQLARDRLLLEIMEEEGCYQGLD